MFSETTNKNFKKIALAVLSASAISSVFGISALFASAPRDEQEISNFNNSKIDQLNIQEKEPVIRGKSEKTNKIRTKEQKSILREASQSIKETDEFIAKEKEEGDRIKKGLEIKAFPKEMKRINRQIGYTISKKIVEKDDFQEKTDQINAQVDDAKLVMKISKLEIQVLNKELEMLDLNDNSEKSKICSEMKDMYVELAELNSERSDEYTKLSQLNHILAQIYDDLAKAKDELSESTYKDMINKITYEKNEVNAKMNLEKDVDMTEF